MAINDTLLPLLNQSDVAVHRSIRAIESENSIHSANLFAPDYVVGMCLVFVMNEWSSGQGAHTQFVHSF